MNKDIVIDGSKLTDTMRYRVAMMLAEEVEHAHKDADEVEEIATDDGDAMTEAEQRYVTECITYANILQKTIDELADEDWNKKTYYLCNKKAPECRRLCRPLEPLCHCRHTKKPEYAINEPCQDPENHPERFEHHAYMIGTFVVHQYWEKGVERRDNDDHD